MSPNEPDDATSPLDPRTIAELRALDAGGDGSSPFLRALIADFSRQSEREMNGIDEALHAGDLAAAGRIAHGLGGAAHTVGARDLGRAARAFEDACLRDDREEASGGALAALRREYAAAIGALRTLG